MQQNERNASRTRSPRGKSPSGRMSRWPCKDYLKGTCTKTHCVKSGTVQNACTTRPRAVVGLGKSARMHIAKVDEQPSQRSKKNGDKSAVAMLKKNEQNERTVRPVVYAYSSNTRQLGCVFQDMEPPKLSSILRKSSDMQKPIQRVKIHESYCTSR